MNSLISTPKYIPKKPENRDSNTYMNTDAYTSIIHSSQPLETIFSKPTKAISPNSKPLHCCSFCLEFCSLSGVTHLPPGQNLSDLVTVEKAK